jgi:hypothetical protein
MNKFGYKRRLLMVRVLLAGVVAVLLILPSARADEKDDPYKIPADAKAILEKAESFELLSLEPRTAREVPKESFHGWKVLGKKIDKAEVRKQLVEAFEKGVTENKGDMARCFLPRHGIRVTHDGKSAAFVICFQCNQVRVYVGGEAERVIHVSDSPAEVFNKVLKDAGVELPEQPKK